MTIQEFDVRYGIDSSKFKRYEFNNLNVIPKEFDYFNPYLKYYAIMHQDERFEFIESLPDDAIKELKEKLHADPNLVFWFADDKTVYNIGNSDLFIAFCDVCYIADGGVW